MRWCTLLSCDAPTAVRHTTPKPNPTEQPQQATTTIHEQRLIAPRALELSAMEELVILEHLEAFRRNGFQFQVDESAGPMQRLKVMNDENGLGGRGAKHDTTTRSLVHLITDTQTNLHIQNTPKQLLSLPYSKGVQFGPEDIHELASLLGDAHLHQPHATTTTNEVVRLPKLRAMFASRACRMSIMIGRALTRAQMRKVVKNLAGIEQPWNCPHGRPTMRHLLDLSALE